MKEYHAQSNLSFRLMALKFRLRDRQHPPEGIPREAGVRPGMTVLDFGCGPGGFSLAAARLAGPAGQVLALDAHPLAVKSVLRAAAENGILNIRTILGSDMTSVFPASVDIALLYDVLHDLREPGGILREFHRVLKPEGVLSVSDHHLQEAFLLKTMAADGLFRLAGRTRWTLQFTKTKAEEAVKGPKLS